MDVDYRTESDNSSSRRRRGTSLLEVVVGGLVMIPVVLLALDAAVVMIASRTNNQVAQKAARTAANCKSSDEALLVVQDAIRSCPTSDIIESVALDHMDFDTTTKLVSVTTDMKVILSVPLPGMTAVELKALATEPIVSIPAER